MKKYLILLLIFIGSACSKIENNTIPFYPVYLELDLTYEDKDLNNLFSSKIYTSKNINSAVEKAGFGGVLIFHGEDIGYGAYQAYDIACPNEASASTVVHVDDTGIHAICPVCGSKYELTGSGFPTQGSPSKHKLQSYTVREVQASTSKKLIVTN